MAPPGRRSSLFQRARPVLAREAQARAQVKLAIEDALDEGLPRAYTPDLYKTKCSVVFEHILEKFGEAA